MDKETIEIGGYVNTALEKISFLTKEDFHGYRSEVWNAVAVAIKSALAASQARCRELEGKIIEITQDRDDLQNAWNNLEEDNAALRERLRDLEDALRRIDGHIVSDASDAAAMFQEIARRELEKQGMGIDQSTAGEDRVLIETLTNENTALRARLKPVEEWLAFALEEGLISRGVFASLMQVDRCDVDDKAMAIKAGEVKK